MKRSNAFLALCLSSLFLAACGGGGGGSSAAPAASGGSTGGATGGGTTGGGTTGGGTTGGGTTGGGVSLGVLAPGGVSLLPSDIQIGVGLDVRGSGSGLSIQLGDIQGFSSIILNGVTVNTDAATFRVEGATGTQADLRQGQQVLLISDDTGANAVEVLYRANIKGELTQVTGVDTALGTGTLVVLGQSVLVDAATAYFDTDLPSLAAGQLVEVSGTVNADGDLVASFIELQTSLDEYKVVGTISNAGANGFSLNALSVDTSSATLADFDGAPANGDVVEVKAAPSGFTAPDQLVATRVERLPQLSVGTGALANVEGFIDRFDGADDFSVQGVPVTTDGSTTYLNGTAASLALGVKVQVEGSTDDDGVLVASRVTIQRTEAVRAEGPIEALDTTNETLTVLGVVFVTRDSLRLEDDSSAGVDPLTFADLGIGDEVEVRGYLDGETVVATRIEREDAADRARLRGPVGAEDAAAGTVTVLGVTITGQSGVTQYEDLDDNIITQAQFHDAVQEGTFVQGRWDNYVDTNQVVDELSVED